MPVAQNLIATGIPPAQAEQIGYSNLTPISAAGTTSATATVIKSLVTQIEVTASAGHTGLRLAADAECQQDYFILNSSATNAKVYPPTGGSIDGGSADAPISVDTNVSRIFVRIDRTRWVTAGASANAPVMPGITQIVTAGSSVTVGSNITTLILNKIIAGATTVQLGSVASRSTPIQIVDWAGNAGDITVLPNGAETIMGLGSATLLSYAQGLGASANITLYPNTTMNGWYNAT